MNRLKEYFSDITLLFVAIIWGTGFIATDIAIKYGYSTFRIIAGRFLCASLILGIIFYKKVLEADKETIKAGSVLGVLLCAGFCLQTKGLEFTTISKNAFLTATNVVFVPLLVWGIYRKRPQLKSFIAALICFSGVGMLSFSSQLNGINIGDILTLFAAMFFALHFIGLDYWVKKHDAITLAVIQLMASGIISLIFSLIFDRSPIEFNEGAWGILFLGVFNTAIAYIGQNVAQKYTSATKASVILSSESVFGTLLSAFILKEYLSINMIIGCILIFSSLIVSEINFKAKRRKEALEA